MPGTVHPHGGDEHFDLKKGFCNHGLLVHSIKFHYCMCVEGGKGHKAEVRKDPALMCIRHIQILSAEMDPLQPSVKREPHMTE